MGWGIAAGRSSRAPYVASCTCLMQNDYLCVCVCTLSGERARVTAAEHYHICLRDAPIRVQQQFTWPRAGRLSKCVGAATMMTHGGIAMAELTDQTASSSSSS